MTSGFITPALGRVAPKLIVFVVEVYVNSSRVVIVTVFIM